MKTVCEKNMCSGCLACIESCNNNAIKIDRGIDAYNAIIDPEKCVECNICRKVCQAVNNADDASPIKWFQGWAAEKTRQRGSSGGVAGALSAAFVEQGGYVCSCKFENGKFGFAITDSLKDIGRFSGSKYVKSDPQGVYSQIAELLKCNKKVLFIALPCQVAALKRFIKGDHKNLYTVDLICHGTPSPEILNIFLKQHGYNINSFKDIRFREKVTLRKGSGQGYKSIGSYGTNDRYSIAFLNGLIFTENCYSCKYAKLRRVSDITLGDSWGSDLDSSEKAKGISLVLCQTQKGMALLNDSRIHKKNVNIEEAVKANDQLNAPFKKPEERRQFIAGIKSGENFDKLVMRFCKKACIKQMVKCIMIKTHLFKEKWIRYGISFK